MLGQVEVLFEDRAAMMRKLKKNSYEDNMKRFRDDHGKIIDEMISAIKESDDSTASAERVGADFADKIHDAYMVNGKIRGADQADLNLFMIYYVFPAILLTGDTCAPSLCEGLKKAWNNRFKNTNISYTDYETLYDAFRNKIFGLF